MARHDPRRDAKQAYGHDRNSDPGDDQRREYYDPDNVYRGGDRFNSGYGASWQSHRAFDPSAHDLGRDGTYRGRGPKGYARSDGRIREDVCDLLTDDPHVDASSVEVLVRDGEVTLTGTVDSRDARRHAEDLADRIRGVKHVGNDLRVAGRADLMKASTTPLFRRSGARTR